MASTPSSNPKTGTIPLKPAQYGRACAGCAKAKCRCLTRSGSVTCERCTRLKISCVSSDVTRKRATKSAGNARLEEKVDGIISLLQSHSKPDSNSTAASESTKGTDFSLHGLEFRLHDDANGDRDVASQASATLDSNIRNFANFTFMGTAPADDPLDVQSRGNSHTSHSSPWSQCSNTPSASRSSAFDLKISPEDAERYLDCFRTEFLPGFAFVHISQHMTAGELEQTRPFLFLAIMMVASPPTTISPQRSRLGDEIKRRVAREILSDQEGNLDVLLGLLVFLTWGHDQLLATHLASRFTQLAISMMFDLRLNKQPPKETPTYSIFNLGAYDGKGHSKRTMEERRTVLGCWMLSSFMSWYFVKIDPLQWTSYMDECVDLLSANPECPADTVFAAQIRLQILAEKTAQCASSISKNGLAGLKNTKASVPFYIHALNAELNEVKRGLSTVDHDNVTLQSYIHHTSLSISALALSPTSALTTPDSFPTTNSRLASLTLCLSSLVQFFTRYFAIPPTAYRTLAFPRFTHLAHSIVVLYHLTVLEEEGWNRRGVREVCDVEEVLRGLVGSFGQMTPGGEVKAGAGEINMPAKLAWIFERAGMWVRGKLGVIEAKERAAVGIVDGSGIEGVLGGEGFGGSGIGDGVGIGLDFGGEDVAMVNLFDDAWLSDVLGPWTYDFM